MDLLPLEVIGEILKLTNFNQVSLISKQFNLLVENLWDYYLERDYNHEFLKGSNKDKYIKCYKLTKLLNNKKFKISVTDIAELYNLQHLDLSNNQIKEIPKQIGQLVNLQQLYLSNNQIKEIPKELCQLSNLQTLSLSNNSIKKIPKELSQLINLQHLFIHNNSIKEIPKEMGQLVKFTILRFV